MQAVIIHDVFEHFIHVSLLFDHESQLEGDDAPVGRPLEAALHDHPLSVVLQAVADLRPPGVPVRRLHGNDVFLVEEIGMKFVAAVPVKLESHAGTFREHYVKCCVSVRDRAV